MSHFSDLGKLKERLKNPPKFMIKDSPKSDSEPLKKCPVSSLVFGIDCDEVLAKFKSSAFEVLRNITGKIYNEDEMLEWDFNKFLSKEETNPLWEYINESPSFVNEIKPFDDALKALPKIAQIGEIFIVTAPLIKCNDFMQKRNRWLAKWFKIEPSNICYTKRKEFFGCDVFIDDHPENVIAWRNRNLGIAILWEKPYNSKIELETEKGKIIRTCNWDEVLEISKNFARTKQDILERINNKHDELIKLASQELKEHKKEEHEEVALYIRRGEKRYINGVFAEKITPHKISLGIGNKSKCEWKNIETNERFYSDCYTTVFLEKP